ncbi:NAD(P)H-binding protein [Devosia sp. WQ 349]|uniref:NAD-dependent epimerase/dehydratase family protein n=1 Tax=Devosia sp. WQ 349K1 TaxID=2800329 RepID=UPI001903CEEB|nr:NAD(P)H-binding protein [Devosia sp. WQ 349K1]MBK1794032.1 NAD(P)H-binding protein [Devosia sp. WQ 349K1]
MRKAVVIGGTGQIGRRVAADLAKDGYAVSVTHRGGHGFPQELRAIGVTAVVHDRSREPLAPVIAGADLVVDAIAFGPEHGRQLLAARHDVGRFVVISSASVYCDAQGRSLDEAQENGFPDLPEAMVESQSVLSPGDENYSTRKVALEHVLLGAQDARVTILRPCAIHGVGSVNPREWWLVKRLLDGRTRVPLAFAGKSRFHTTSVDNISAVVRLVALGDAPRILNVGDAACLSVQEIGAVIAQALGSAVEFVDSGDDYPSTIGGTPWSVPAPFMIDSGAAIAIGYQPKSYAESIGPVITWLAHLHQAGGWETMFPAFAKAEHNPFDYAAEDAFLAA